MEKFILIAFFVVLVITVVRMLRYGGMTGMLVGSRTQERLGTVEGRAVGHRRVSLTIHRLEGDRPIGIHFTGRAAMSVERIAASLSREDARRLARALENAASEQGGA